MVFSPITIIISISKLQTKDIVNFESKQRDWSKSWERVKQVLTQMHLTEGGPLQANNCYTKSKEPPWEARCKDVLPGHLHGKIIQRFCLNLGVENASCLDKQRIWHSFLSISYRAHVVQERKIHLAQVFKKEAQYAIIF